MEKWMKGNNSKVSDLFSDSDGDGVADVFDCSPHNKDKQDMASFISGLKSRVQSVANRVRGIRPPKQIKKRTEPVGIEPRPQGGFKQLTQPEGGFKQTPRQLPNLPTHKPIQRPKYPSHPRPQPKPIRPKYPSHPRPQPKPIRPKYPSHSRPQPPRPLPPKYINRPQRNPKLTNAGIIAKEMINPTYLSGIAAGGGTPQRARKKTRRFSYQRAK